MKTLEKVIENKTLLISNIEEIQKIRIFKN